MNNGTPSMSPDELYRVSKYDPKYRAAHEVIKEHGVVERGGDNDPETVKLIQRQLKKVLGLGDEFKIDGKFGPETEKRIKEYQSKGSSTPDGKIKADDLQFFIRGDVEESYNRSGTAEGEVREKMRLNVERFETARTAAREAAREAAKGLALSGVTGSNDNTQGSAQRIGQDQQRSGGITR